MSNYPAGVSDAHPYFNPGEVPINMTCEAEEALVVPSFAIKAALIEIHALAGGGYKGDGGQNRPANHGTIVQRIEQLQRLIDEAETETDYDCSWEGEMELPVSEHTEWDCPRCGVTQVADTTGDDR